MQEWTGIPVHVGDHSRLKLTCYEGPGRVIPDDSDRKTLRCRDGFVTDDKWALVFTSDPRRNAEPQDYDLYWTDLLYGGESTRKSSLTISMTDLCELQVKVKDGDWVPKVMDARFKTTMKGKIAHIELAQGSTFVLLHRCLGRVMAMAPKNVKDSPVEPYRRLFEFLAAMDYDGFGWANAACAVNYEHAMKSLVPQPFADDCFRPFGRYDDLDHPRPRMTPDLEQPACIESLRRLIETPERTRIIYLEEIGADVRLHMVGRRSPAGTSPSAIRRRITNIGLDTVSVRGVGTAITVADYREHRNEFLNPRDRRTRLPDV